MVYCTLWVIKIRIISVGTKVRQTRVYNLQVTAFKKKKNNKKYLLCPNPFLLCSLQFKKKKKRLPSPHQSEHVSQPLGSVINGLHCLAERHSRRTMGILKGHYPYKTPSCCWTIGERLMQSRSTLNIFCVNIRACLWSKDSTNGVCFGECISGVSFCHAFEFKYW